MFKTILVFAAILALTNGRNHDQVMSAYDRSISSTILELIEGVREQMPCGFEKFNIPSLAPLELTHKNVSVDTDGFAFEGDVDNVCLIGLNEFDIVECRLNSITSKFTYEFYWPQIYVNNIYDLLIRIGSGGRMQMKRHGDAYLSVKGLKVWGTAKYSLGLLTGNLRLKEFYVYTSIEEVDSKIENLSSIKAVNKMFNDIIEEWITLAINDNTDNIGDMSNDLIVPIVNQQIGDATLSDIISIVIGDGNGDGEEKEKCVPVKYECTFDKK